MSTSQGEKDKEKMLNIEAKHLAHEHQWQENDARRDAVICSFVGKCLPLTLFVSCCLLALFGVTGCASDRSSQAKQANISKGKSLRSTTKNSRAYLLPPRQAPPQLVEIPPNTNLVQNVSKVLKQVGTEIHEQVVNTRSFIIHEVIKPVLTAPIRFTDSWSQRTEQPFQYYAESPQPLIHFSSDVKLKSNSVTSAEVLPQTESKNVRPQYGEKRLSEGTQFPIVLIICVGILTLWGFEKILGSSASGEESSSENDSDTSTENSGPRTFADITYNDGYQKARGGGSLTDIVHSLKKDLYFIEEGGTYDKGYTQGEKDRENYGPKE